MRMFVWRTMLKRIIAIALIYLFAAPVMATTVDEVCAFLTERKATTGDFAQEKTAKALKRPLKSSGTFRIDEAGIEWRTVKPFKSVMKVEKTKITQIGADGKENIIEAGSNQVFQSVAQMMSAVFSGDKSALEDAFFVDFADEGESCTLSMKPKDKTIQSAISSIDMRVDCVKKEMRSVLVTQANGDTILYTFSNQLHPSF